MLFIREFFHNIVIFTYLVGIARASRGLLCKLTKPTDTEDMHNFIIDSRNAEISLY